LISIEVGLLDAAVLERDLAVKRRSDSENDPALNLRSDDIGIDDSAAINRADDTPDTNRAVLRDFDFGDMRHVVGEGVLDRNTTANPFGQGLSPAGLLCRELEDGFGTRRLLEEARR
jgi:hypothetical protein